MHIAARLLREPLVHFLVAGAALFGLYSLAAPDSESPPPRERIVVSEGRVTQLAEIFTRTWQRPPTAEELGALVDGYVKEEIYYREAVKLGLDADDTVVRRRMQQKMEFLIEPPEAALQAGEAELQSYLAAHRARFRIEPQVAFQHFFIRPGRDGEAAVERASLLLDELRRGAAETGQGLAGDPTLLPGEMPLAPLYLVARRFGEDFAAALPALPPGEWRGPIESPYGLHLVRVASLIEGYDPPLSEVRAQVLQAWREARRAAFAEETYRRLREGYDVIPPGAGGPAEGAPR